MKKFFILTLIAALVGCEKAPDHHRNTTPHVTTSAGTESIFESASDDGFDYTIFADERTRSCPCYTYSSPTRVTNMSSVSFQRSVMPPASVSTSPTGSTGVVNLTKVGTTNDLDEKEQQEIEKDLAPEPEPVNEQVEPNENEVETPETEAPDADVDVDTASDSSADVSSDAGGGDSGGGGE